MQCPLRRRGERLPFAEPSRYSIIMRKTMYIACTALLLFLAWYFSRFVAANTMHSVDVISDISANEDALFVMPAARVRHLVLGVPRSKRVSPDSVASIEIKSEDGTSIQWSCRLSEVTQANWQTAGDLESYILSWGKTDPSFGEQLDKLKSKSKCQLHIKLDPKPEGGSSLRLFYVAQ